LCNACCSGADADGVLLLCWCIFGGNLRWRRDAMLPRDLQAAIAWLLSGSLGAAGEHAICESILHLLILCGCWPIMVGTSKPRVTAHPASPGSFGDAEVR
jgi:hypothetical protein